MKRAVLSLISIFSCLPLLARQEITPPTFGSTAYKASNPVVATNGETFLALWTVDTNLGGKHVYGSLADAKGRPLSPLSSLIIPNASISQLFGSASGYVAIVADRNGAGAARTARLSSDGRFAGFGSALPAFPAAYHGSEPYVARAFNGSEFLTVGYTDNNFPPGETVALESRADGSVIRQITLTKFARFDTVASGSDFVVATAESNGVFLRRFGRDGSDITARTRVSAISNPVVSIALASIGEETAVAWSERSLTNDVVHLAIVTRDGVVMNHSQFPAPFFGSLQLRSNASSYVLMAGQPALFVFDRAGQQLDGTLVIAPGAGNFAVTDTYMYAVGGTGYLTRIVIGMAAALDRSLTPSTPTVLSTMLRRQVWPVIASDGAGFLAIWSDQTGEAKNLAAMRMDQNGVPLDTAQLDLGAASAPYDDLYGYGSGFGSSPGYCLAFGQAVYLVVWQAGSDVVARRIDRSGNLLDQQPIVIQKNASVSDRAVVWNGNDFFVTWLEQAGLRAATVTESGTVSKSLELPRVQGPGVPSVSWDGRRYLLTAILYVGPICTCTPTPNGLLVLRLSAAGISLDQVPTVLPIPTSSYRVATSGHDFLLLSDEYDSRGVQFRMEARKVIADEATLQVSAPVRVFEWSQPTGSQVDWNGHEYVVAWRYGLGERRWLGLLHLTEDLKPFTRLDADVAPDIYDRPSLATNAAGEEMIAISEISSSGSAARIRTLSEREMRLQPPAPPTTLITSAVGTTQSAVVTWQVSPTAQITGFIIEASNPYTNFATTIAILPADARSATVSIASSVGAVTPRLAYVRMRTFNAGGVSEPTASVHVTLPLRNHR